MRMALMTGAGGGDGEGDMVIEIDRLDWMKIFNPPPYLPSTSLKS